MSLVRGGYPAPMVRRIREEYIDDDPVIVEPVARRRVITERHVGDGYGFGPNPLAWVVAAVLVVFILLLLFGGLR